MPQLCLLDALYITFSELEKFISTKTNFWEENCFFIETSRNVFVFQTSIYIYVAYKYEIP